MATSKLETSRRGLLAGLAIIGAAAGIPAVSAATTTSRAAWDRALAKFRYVSAIHTRLWQDHDDAEEAVGRACPRVDKYFDDYDLYLGLNRERAREYAYSACFRREFGERGGIVMWPKAKREVSEAKLARIAREADSIAGEFMGFQERSREADKVFRTDELLERAKAINEPWKISRDELMKLTAPDHEGLLVKIEIAAISLEEDHGQSMLSDAQRLLTERRA